MSTLVGAAGLVAGSLHGMASAPAVPAPPAVKVRIGDVSVPEGNGVANETARLPIRLSASTTSTRCVWYHTEDATAMGAATGVVHDGSHDYVRRVAKVVKVRPGSTVTSVDLLTVTDDVAEGDETFRVVIDRVSGTTGSTCGTTPDPAVQIVDGTGIVTILDDDPAPITSSLSVGDVAIPEGDGSEVGNAALGVRLSAPAPGDLCVRYHTEDETATGSRSKTTHDGSHDYQTRSGQHVTIAAGQVTASIHVVTVPDSVKEPDETFAVVVDQVSASVGGACQVGPVPGTAVSDGRGVVTIVDDDPSIAPPAPTSVVASAVQDPCTTLCGTVTVSWTAPYDGGSPITRYDVYVSSDGSSYALAGTTTGATSTTVQCAVPSTCTAKVAATNAIGTGPLSSPSNPVTILDTKTPGPVRNVEVFFGSPDAEITWQPPTNPGSAPLVGYAVYGSFDSGASWFFIGQNGQEGSSRPCPPGYPCRFRIVAVNAFGEGVPTDTGDFFA